MAISVVTVEDCTTEVMPMPVGKALKRWWASRAMRVLSREPAIARSAADMIDMPCRNSASPPARPISIGVRARGSWSIVQNTSGTTWRLDSSGT